MDGMNVPLKERTACVDQGQRRQEGRAASRTWDTCTRSQCGCASNLDLNPNPSTSWAHSFTSGCFGSC